MSRRRRREPRLFVSSGRRNESGLADPTAYWPLTITPSTTRPRRPVPALLVIGALAVLGAGLLFAVRRGIPAW